MSATASPAPLSSLVVPEGLLSTLKPHQHEGLHFLWKRLVDDGFLIAASKSHRSSMADRLEAQRMLFGAVLGHSMGLGKTLTSLCFVMCFQSLLHRRIVARKHVSPQAQQSLSTFPCCPRLRVLIITPRSCIPHWEQSLEEWIRRELFGEILMPIFIPSYYSQKDFSAKREACGRFYRTGGCMVLGYEEHRVLMHRFREEAVNLQSPATVARVSSLLDQVRMPLDRKLSATVNFAEVLESCDLVLLDESHRLKNAKSKTVVDMRRNVHKVPLRVALTGTPLQNHLEEYVCMKSVVTEISLDMRQFRKTFVLPISIGQCSDATQHEVDRMQTCVHHLRTLFSDVVHRAGVEILEKDLPPRFESILFVELSKKQEEVYLMMLRRWGASVAVLQLRQEAGRICAHPILAANYDSLPATNTLDGEDLNDTSSSSDVSTSDDDDTFGKHQGGGGGTGRSRLRSERERLEPSLRRGVPEEDNNRARRLSSPSFSQGHRMHGLQQFPGAMLEDSPKLHVCIEIIKEVIRRREKAVVFAMFIPVMRLLEYFLRQQGIGCFFLTGDTPLAERKAMMSHFRKAPLGEEPFVFLCSTKAGGVGINLLPANHCILLENSWNPADDNQAIYRIYRYGQTKKVFIYRLCSYATAEHVVFHYTLRKEWMHRKIADVGDPTRREREERSHYSVYPCSLPISGWILNPLTDTTKKTASSPSTMTPLASDDPTLSTTTFGGFLQACCPTVLALPNGLRKKIVGVVEHSFLLQDNSDEMIKDLHKHLAARAIRSELVGAPSATMKFSDAPVVQVLHPAEDNVVSKPTTTSIHSQSRMVGWNDGYQVSEAALQQQSIDLARALYEHWKNSGRGDERSILELDGWGKTVRGLLFDVASMSGGILVNGGVGESKQHTLLNTCGIEGILLEGYRMACKEFLDTITLSHRECKVYLEARAMRLRAEVPKATSLLDSLWFFGATIWKGIPRNEACRYLTETKFRRSFVREMMIHGVRLWLSRLQERLAVQIVSDGPEILFEAVSILLGADVATIDARTDSKLFAKWLDSAIANAVDDAFPEYEDLPEALVDESKLREANDRLMRAVTNSVSDNHHSPSSISGEGSIRSVLSLSEATAVLNIPPVPKRRGLYLCCKCERGVIRTRFAPSSTAPSQQEDRLRRLCSCDTCSFDVSEALEQMEGIRSDLILETWSMSLNGLSHSNILASFDHSISGGDDSLPAHRFGRGRHCRRHSDTGNLFVVRSAFETFPKMLHELGIEILTTQLPAHPIILLARQCGVRSIPALQRRLASYGSSLFSKYVHDGMRQWLKALLAPFRSSSSFQHQRVPELFVLLALQFIASTDVPHTRCVLEDIGSSQEVGEEEEGEYEDRGGKNGDDLEPAIWFTDRSSRLLIFREVLFTVASHRYFQKLEQKPLPGRQRNSKRLRADEDSSPAMGMQATEFMPWSDDPARRLLQQRDAALDVDGYLTSESSDDSVSLWNLTTSSDEEDGGVRRAEGSGDHSAVVAAKGRDDRLDRMRQRLYWTALVEVFGPSVLEVPMWMERGRSLSAVNTRGKRSETEGEEDCDEAEPMLLIPDDDVVRRLQNVRALTPTEAADAFFEIIRHRSAEIPLVA